VLEYPVPFHHRFVETRRIESSTLCTPEPPSAAVPQIPEGEQPAFQPAAL
jgi:hypothetical protein